MKICLYDLLYLAKIDINIKSLNHIGDIKIDADNVNSGDFFVAIDCCKYDLTDGAIGFTNNEDSVFGLGGTIELEKTINTALQNGARYVFLDNKILFDNIKDRRCILIDDCMDFLIEIAKHIINQTKVKTIAVTGSMGKTTTVFAVYNLLSVKYNVIRIHRIRNSILGMSFEIINNLSEDTDFLIVEMQLDEKKQIDSFCRIAKPDFSVITSINYSHYSRFQSIDTILYEKTAVYRNLKVDGKCLINGDDIRLSKWAAEQKDKRIIKLGFSDINDLYFSSIEKCGKLNCYTVSISGLLNHKKVKTNINNKGTLIASLYAIYFAKLFNIDFSILREYINKTNNPVGRFNGFRGVNDSFVIVDSYNANSNSVINGLEYVNGLKNYKTKIILLGSLLELGDKTESEHIKVGKYINDFCDFNYLITLGEGATYIAKQINNKISQVKSFFEYEDIIGYINKNITIDSSTVIYIKGSGGMRMEILAPHFLSTRLF